MWCPLSRCSVESSSYTINLLYKETLILHYKGPYELCQKFLKTYNHSVSFTVYSLPLTKLCSNLFHQEPKKSSVNIVSYVTSIICKNSKPLNVLILITLFKLIAKGTAFSQVLHCREKTLNTNSKL